VKYRLVIFDFDGTLADSFPWFASVLNDVAERFGFRKIDEAEGEALRGCDPREIIRRLGVPLWKLPMIATHMRALKAASTHHMPLFPGVGDLLRHLSSRGAALAIVSSDTATNIRHVLGPESAALIRHYECSVPIFGKPARIRKVLKTSGIPPRETICIGDEIRDAEAARQAGVAFGAVSWGYARLEALTPYAPAEIFASIDDIADIVA
jgi:phosphoglycolate phosphatase